MNSLNSSAVSMDIVGFVLSTFFPVLGFSYVLAIRDKEATYIPSWGWSV